MTAPEVLDLLDRLSEVGVISWLDGGWGVDCLLGKQTRSHGDLDLVVRRDDLGTIEHVLHQVGFVVLRDWLPTSIAYRDDAGREVDLHPINPTADGGGDQLLEDAPTWHYLPPVTGTLAGRVVQCCSAEEQLRMHQGYPPRELDIADVEHLADRFGLDVPASLRRSHGGSHESASTQGPG